MTRDDRIWQQAHVSQRFLDGVRGAIPLASEQIDVMLRLVQKARQEVKNFLDLGCGDGVLGRALLAQYPEAQGLFVDFSETMLDAARQSVGTQHGVSLPHLTFIQGDYGSPAWLDAVQSHAPFDVIVSGFSIHHQPDARKREVYAEIYALLNPGGIFLNLEHVAPLSAWVESLFDDMMIDTMYAYDLQNGGSKTRARVAEDHHNRPDKAANILAPVELQCEWLREIGYQHVDCYFKLFELALFGGLKSVS